MDSFGNTSLSFLRIFAAPISPGWSFKFSCQYSLVSLTCLNQTDSSVFLICFCKSNFTIILSEVRTSPTTAKLVVWFLPISAGSTSIWIIFNRFSKASKVPTDLSENLVPIAKTQSASAIILFASAWPCIPIGPSDNGWFSGNAPLPLKVVTTGSIKVSAIDCNSANADEIIVPPPAKIIGFSELSNISIAFSQATISGSVQGW